MERKLANSWAEDCRGLNMGHLGRLIDLYDNEV